MKSGTISKTIAEKGYVYTNILNPMAQQKLEWDMIPLVERPSTLEGKTGIHNKPEMGRDKGTRAPSQSHSGMA